MSRKYTKLPFTEFDVALGNFDTSRKTIDTIILHTMVGKAPAATARFATPGAGASAHYGVKYDGGLVAWLEEYYTAYHCGNYLVNQQSIGIEHEDNGMVNGVYDDGPRPDALYTASAKLVADICKFYAIPCDRDHIKKHKEVALNPTACPDALDVDRIVREAQALLSPPDQTADLKKQIALLNAKILAAQKALQ